MARSCRVWPCLVKHLRWAKRRSIALDLLDYYKRTRTRVPVLRRNVWRTLSLGTGQSSSRARASRRSSKGRGKGRRRKKKKGTKGERSLRRNIVRYKRGNARGISFTKRFCPVPPSPPPPPPSPGEGRYGFLAAPAWLLVLYISRFYAPRVPPAIRRIPRRS